MLEQGGDCTVALNSTVLTRAVVDGGRATVVQVCIRMSTATFVSTIDTVVPCRGPLFLRSSD